MATYQQWSRSRTIRPVTWVCGAESVLVRDVIAAHRDGSTPEQRVTLYAGQVPERDIWDLLLSVPATGGRRVVVYGAEKLKHPGNAALLAGADGLEAALTVFVEGGADFEKRGTALAPHLAALQASKAAQLVRCCAPASTEDRVALVASWWPGAAKNFAHDLLTRCGGLERAWQACEQARLAGLRPESAMAAMVCPAEPAGEMTDLLFAGDKARAVAAAALLSKNEVGMVIGQLASRLMAVEQVRAAMAPGMSAREAANRGGVDRWAANRVVPHLGSYGSARISHLRRLLAHADSAWRRGVQAGIAEMICAMW
jgi:hypothetical protein